MKKIVHIGSDEKFINSAYWQFNEIFPGQNIFYLIIDEPEKQLKYVQLNDNFILIESNLKKLKKIAESFSNQVIVVHGLDYFKSFIIHHLPKSCEIIWMVWGAEVYNNPEIVAPSTLYGQGTYSSYIFPTQKEKIKKIFKDTLRPLFYKLKYQTETPNKLIFNAIKKADHCAILYKEEYEFIRTIPGVKSSFFKFSYYPIERMVGDTNARITGNNILIGNSASETNNHLEAFLRLKEIPLKEKKIITPLSYGNSSYGNGIIEKGEKLFGNNFQPLIDFMPLHEYNEHLQQCGIVIMNHYRQQAVGNVIAMLWMGAKVYLDERNTLFYYLKRLGVEIFSITKDLNPQNQDCLELLSKSKQDHNRNILKTEINQNILLEQLKSQIALIL